MVTVKSMQLVRDS